jgi:hypothetical protein
VSSTATALPEVADRRWAVIGLATLGIALFVAVGLATNALPIVAGTTLFGEGLPDGPLGVLRVLAFAAVVIGAGAIARPGEAGEPAPSLTAEVVVRTID